MKRIVIAGCGYVGRHVARLFHQGGWEVLAITHSRESQEALRGEPFATFSCDMTRRSDLSALGLNRVDVVVHCASSGRGGAQEYRKIYLEGAENLQAAFFPKRLLFTSSTSVYAQTDGSCVDETSAAEPDRETGAILRSAERYVLGVGGIVARLAGIYGPGRSVLLAKFLEGRAVIEGDGGRWINQIHRDDAASAIFFLLNGENASGLYNVADDSPMTQRDCYGWLAGKFGRPLPPVGPVDANRKRGWTSKRVTNQKLRALGWTPKYPSFKDAVLSDTELCTGLIQKFERLPPQGVTVSA